VVKPAKGAELWPRRVSIALGVAALAQACFLAGWLAASDLPSTGAAALLLALYALAMGFQSGAVMALGVKAVFTTAATATVIGLMSDMAGWSRSEQERRRFAGVLVGLCAGAAAGGLLLEHANAWAPVLPLIVTVLVIAVASVALRPAR
jgi:uncharacterized membrane protein YoaK (UPF0700 family)